MTSALLPQYKIIQNIFDSYANDKSDDSDVDISCIKDYLQICFSELPCKDGQISFFPLLGVINGEHGRFQERLEVFINNNYISKLSKMDSEKMRRCILDVFVKKLSTYPADSSHIKKLFSNCEEFVNLYIEAFNTSLFWDSCFSDLRSSDIYPNKENKNIVEIFQNAEEYIESTVKSYFASCIERFFDSDKQLKEIKEKYEQVEAKVKTFCKRINFILKERNDTENVTFELDDIKINMHDMTKHIEKYIYYCLTSDSTKDSKSAGDVFRDCVRNIFNDAKSEKAVLFSDTNKEKCITALKSFFEVESETDKADFYYFGSKKHPFYDSIMEINSNINIHGQKEDVNFIVIRVNSQI